MKVDHISILVKSIKNASETYQLLFKVKPKLFIHEEQMVKVAIFHLTNIKIELIEPFTENESLIKRLEANGEGLHHLCLETNDLKNEADRLRKENISPIAKATGGLFGNIQFFNPKNLHGTLVEILEK